MVMDFIWNRNLLFEAHQHKGKGPQSKSQINKFGWVSELGLPAGRAGTRGRRKEEDEEDIEAAVRQEVELGTVAGAGMKDKEVRGATA